MDELPVPFKEAQLVWMKDLDNYIEQCLGRPWSLGQNGVYGQEELASFEVWPNPEATAIVEEWLSSPAAKCPGRLEQPGYGEDVDIITEDILQELCNRGLFPEGDVTVHVWW